MKHDEFKEQFLAVGYSMAQKAKSEVKKIQSNKEDLVKRINNQFAQELKNDILVISAKFVRDYEYSLNQQISDNIKNLSEQILNQKNILLDDLIEAIKNEMVARTNKNRDKYTDYLISSVEDIIPMFDTDIVLKLNSNDQDLYGKIASHFEDKTFQLDEEKADCFGGVIISDINNSVVVDKSLDKLLEKKSILIKQIFSKVFPDYVDIRKSATEMMKERHMEEMLKLPQRLLDFIDKNNIELEL